MVHDVCLLFQNGLLGLPIFVIEVVQHAFNLWTAINFSLGLQRRRNLAIYHIKLRLEELFSCGTSERFEPQLNISPFTLGFNQRQQELTVFVGQLIVAKVKRFYASSQSSRFLFLFLPVLRLVGPLGRHIVNKRFRFVGSVSRS